MQPYFFPYIGYYQAVSAADKYVLYSDFAYIKSGWINRNRLLVVNGLPVYFTLPVKNASSYRKIRDIELADRKAWQRKMLDSVQLNYKRTPFFNEIYPLFERIVTADTHLLADLVVRSVVDVSRYLDIRTEMLTDASRYAELEDRLGKATGNYAKDFPLIRIASSDKKLIRVLEICRIEGADVYINAIGGQALYRKEDFARNNIQLLFLRTDPIVYKQTGETFHANLSIIDVLMNCGKEGTKKLLQNYTLV